MATINRNISMEIRRVPKLEEIIKYRDNDANNKKPHKHTQIQNNKQIKTNNN